jgi:RimJ/RimL family protein N-acetyltransferase
MISFRKPTINDARLYFDWANDKTVRENSYKQDAISFENHVSWFTQKLKSPDCFFYLFTDESGTPAGQVRIDKSKDEIIIGISIDEKFRGKNLGAEMLLQSSNDYFNHFPGATIIAYIKENNMASLKIFRNAGFEGDEKVIVEGASSYKLKKVKQ